MVFMGRGFTSGGQESGSVFSAVVCNRLVSASLVPRLLPAFQHGEEPGYEAK